MLHPSLPRKEFFKIKINGINKDKLIIITKLIINEMNYIYLMYILSYFPTSMDNRELLIYI